MFKTIITLHIQDSKIITIVPSVQQNREGLSPKSLNVLSCSSRVTSLDLIAMQDILNTAAFSGNLSLCGSFHPLYRFQLKFTLPNHLCMFVLSRTGPATNLLVCVVLCFLSNLAQECLPFMMSFRKTESLLMVVIFARK